MTHNTRVWEQEFDEMEKNHGWIPEHKQQVKDFIHNQLQRVREETIEELKDNVLGIIVKNSTGFDTVGNARTWHVDIDAVEKDLSTLNK